MREFLAVDVAPATDGRVRYHALVAEKVLDIVERELRLGAGQQQAHAAALQGLGVADEAELAAGVRSGRFDDRITEVAAVVRATVAAKLAVANPAYAEE